MSDFDISTIREQLRGRVDGDITDAEIHPMANHVNSDGVIFLARDQLRSTHTGRLRRSDEGSDAQAFCRSVLLALEDITDSEPIYSWTATGPDRKVTGFSTPRRLIFIWPY